MDARPLGRRPPTDDRHMAYRLTAATMPTTPTPVVLGCLWFTNFDTPEKIGQRWWIGRDPTNLGRVRGGHCVCIKPASLVDASDWWAFMDQGAEGACVGYGATRAMMLLNRCRYDAFWLYRAAQAVDEWDDTPPEEGTSVRAAMDVLRTAGHRRVSRRHTYQPDLFDGIVGNRWATTVDEVLGCLQSPTYEHLGAVPILNSWGRDGYPHLTYLPLETLDLLLRAEGEATVIDDRF